MKPPTLLAFSRLVLLLPNGLAALAGTQYYPRLLMVPSDKEHLLPRPDISCQQSDQSSYDHAQSVLEVPEYPAFGRRLVGPPPLDLVEGTFALHLLPQHS